MSSAVHRISSLPNELVSFIRNPAFPCVAAKSAVSREQVDIMEAGNLLDGQYDLDILARIGGFVRNYRRRRPLFTSFAVLFRQPTDLTEVAFEKALWRRLAGLHELDRRRHGWDPSVSSDPASPDFSFSLFRQAFFIIGLHPNSSRRSRRFRRPALVFNLHDQFERLRANGSFGRMQTVIRERDASYCGRPNPMLANFGDLSEARQYSGRAVPRGWTCPFRPRTDTGEREAA
ncbi:YqcI/YcgG family protein [Aerophototrophica crusticola]|uniref:YqcI/YcgG family protein n=1 Tax=Aerophototrophica crusticola TaxID=1709002 RepID=A0A858R3M3_9PROT|nr:YqcI/YcgG family protein [Rhodospirillaceae bacterium B3]